MPKKGFQCPNCWSEFCSAIVWWKPRKEFVSGTFDAYKCHDCGWLTEAGTGKKLPEDWTPPRTVIRAQPDLFGVVKNIRDTIKIVPKLVESPSGAMVSVMYVPEDSSEQFKNELMAMSREINTTSSGRKVPDWYKYRTIKRGKGKRKKK